MQRPWGKTGCGLLMTPGLCAGRMDESWRVNGGDIGGVARAKASCLSPQSYQTVSKL